MTCDTLWYEVSTSANARRSEGKRSSKRDADTICVGSRYEIYPGKSIPLAVTSLVTRTAPSGASRKACAARVRADCDIRLWIWKIGGSSGPAFEAETCSRILARTAVPRAVVQNNITLACGPACLRRETSVGRVRSRGVMR